MHDVIIVGTRCAGASTALQLARKGYRVLAVDRATFPSDTMSTHHIQQAGVARLKRWGLLDRLAATGAPATREMGLDVGPFVLRGVTTPIEGVEEAYCVRRKLLDKILVDAAAEAGAEIREGFTVTGLVEENGRVVGIRGHAQGGVEFEERAHLVVGADGMNSPIARMVEAPEYDTTPAYTCIYYSYWSGLPTTTQLYTRDGQFAAMDPTNDGLTLVGVMWPRAEFDRVRANVESEFHQALERISSDLAERVRAGRREERFVGTGSTRNFFRRPHGPGWALVGDAAYHRDAITAQGITDAFRDAELLADTIDAGLLGIAPMDQCLAAYERCRNEAVAPMYAMTCDLAQLQSPPPPMQEMMAALRHNPEQTNRFFGTIAGTVPIPEFYSPENMAAIMGGNLAHA